MYFSLRFCFPSLSCAFCKEIDLFWGYFFYFTGLIRFIFLIKFLENIEDSRLNTFLPFQKHRFFWGDFLFEASSLFKKMLQQTSSVLLAILTIVGSTHGLGSCDLNECSNTSLAGGTITPAYMICRQALVENKFNEIVRAANYTFPFLIAACEVRACDKFFENKRETEKKTINVYKIQTCYIYIYIYTYINNLFYVV